MNVAAVLPGDDPGPVTAVECLRPGPRVTGLPTACAGFREHRTTPAWAGVPASSTVRLTFGFGDPITVVRSPDGSVTRSPSVVSGPHDTPVEVELAGTQHGIVLRCSPLLAYSLLGVPMHELGNAVTDLGTVLAPLSRWVERMAEETRWEQRFALLAGGLAGLRERGPAPEPAIRWAWRRLHRSGGDIRVEALAAEVGWSRRQLARRFRDQVGVSPKTAARIVRFEHAAALLATGHRGGAVAAACGYADQSHLTREVAALSRRVPSDLARGSGQRMSRSFKLPQAVPA